jgi:hypothetical protein
MAGNSSLQSPRTRSRSPAAISVATRLDVQVQFLRKEL